MKNKIYLIILLVLLSFTTAGCNSQKSGTTTGKNIAGTNTQNENVKFPSSVKPNSNSSVIITTSNGDSQNNNIPTLSVDNNVDTKAIQAEFKNFDKGKEAFIFVNKEYIGKIKVGDELNQGITLKKENLTDGVKTLEVVEFQDDDVSKSVIRYNETKLKIIHK